MILGSYSESNENRGSFYLILKIRGIFLNDETNFPLIGTPSTKYKLVFPYCFASERISDGFLIGMLYNFLISLFTFLFA